MDLLTAKQGDMHDLITQIKTNPPTEKDRAYLTRQLVQCTLPHSDLKGQEIFKSQNGSLTLTIRSGYDGTTNNMIGLPYGTIPRILLYWLTNEVLMKKEKTIYLGESLPVFMREVGLDPSKGGPRSDREHLREQMNRLFRSSITIERSGECSGQSGNAWSTIQVAEKGILWWDKGSDSQSKDFESHIVLSDNFFNMIVNSPVPLDKRALQVLKSSSLNLDIYGFVVHKSYQLSQRENKEQFISWSSFMNQLGANYSDVKNFKKKAKAAFDTISMVYDLKIEYPRGGFVIKAAPPAIPHKE